MARITKAQQVALKRVFDRGLADAISNGEHTVTHCEIDSPEVYEAILVCRRMRARSYLTYRRNIMRGFDCIMVESGGMILGIETDGYTHS